MSKNHQGIIDLLNEKIQEEDYPDTREESVATIKAALESYKKASAAKELETKPKRYNFVPKLLFAVLLFVIGVFAGIVTMQIVNPHQAYIGQQSNIKKINQVEKYIDVCTSFGSTQTLTMLRDASIISQKSYEELSKHYKDSSQFIIYFGTKDDQDVIVLVDSEEEVQVAESGFSYRSSELLRYCSEIVGHDLGTKFLNESKSGLFMQVNYFSDSQGAEPYFHIFHEFTIGEKQYVVYYKDQAFKSYLL